MKHPNLSRRQALGLAGAGFLSLLAGCESPETLAPGCGFSAQSAVGLVRAGRLPVIPATIRDIPLGMVLDTGAEISVLTAEAAARAGIVPDPRRTIGVGGVGGSGAYPTAVIPDFLVGHIPVVNPILPVVPFRIPADGSLGMDILGGVDIDLDLPRGRIVLHQGQLCPGGAPPWGVGSYEVPVTPVESQRLPAGARPRRVLIPVAVNGVAGLALLDTGATDTHVGLRFARRAGVDPAQLARVPPISMPGMSHVPAASRPWRFNDLAVGQDHFANPTLLVTDFRNAPWDVVLGLDYLSRRRVWISFTARRLFIARQG